MVAEVCFNSGNLMLTVGPGSLVIGNPNRHGWRLLLCWLIPVAVAAGMLALVAYALGRLHDFAGTPGVVVMVGGIGLCVLLGLVTARIESGWGGRKFEWWEESIGDATFKRGASCLLVEKRRRKRTDRVEFSAPMGFEIYYELPSVVGREHMYLGSLRLRLDSERSLHVRTIAFSRSRALRRELSAAMKRASDELGIVFLGASYAKESDYD